jgi:hypothetical protein
MSLSLDMLRTARRGAEALGTAAAEAARFVTERQMPDGGFRGRGDRSDLYYTAFAVELERALVLPGNPQATLRYVGGFGDGAGLDLIHLASLARCLARLCTGGIPGPLRLALSARVEALRCADGGYPTRLGAERGSIAGAVLALTALSDLDIEPGDVRRLLPAADALRADDGGYANEPGMDTGTTAASAGVLILLGRDAPRDLALWTLSQWVPEGGFLASPRAPIPDLVSTALALYALRTADESLAELRAAGLAFLDGLHRAAGGWAGHALDPVADLEHTFYALLARGCLEP